MKKLFFLFCNIILFITIVSAQSNWEWRNPLPQGNTLLAVHTYNDDIRVAVGDLGTILRTSNGGETWAMKSSGTSRVLRAVSYADEQTILAVGDSGTILRSSNGGDEWSMMTSGVTTTLRGVSFFNATIGTVVGSSGTILRTTDAGITWAVQTPANTNRLNAVVFANADTGFAVGQTGGGNASGVISYTTNAGVVWTQITTVAGGGLTALSLLDANNVFVVGNNRILQTTNSGATWNIDTVTGSWTGISLFPNNSAIVVGQNGVMTRTTDFGATWTSITSGTSSTLQSVSFASTGNGTSIGSAGVTLHSGNYGETWAMQSSNVTSTDLFAVHFVSRNTGTATGSNRTILRTTNGGTTWAQKTGSVLGTVRGVWNVNENSTVAVTDSGSVTRTTDGGETWNAVQYGAAQPFYAVRFVSGVNGFIAGGSGKILRTTNGGETWDSVSTGQTNALVGLYFYNAEIGVAVGSGGRIIKTTDGGTTWAVQVSNTNQILRSAYFSDVSNGVIVGDGGIILNTTNGGETWTNTPSGTNSNLRSVSFGNTMNGTIVGQNGVMLTSTDGGVTWTSQSRFTANLLYAVHFTDLYTGTAIGASGTILRKQLNIDPPTAPTLASPENGSTQQPTTIELQWNSVSGAETYNLQVATDSLFSSILIDDEGISGTSHQVSLGSDTKYYWHVQAENLAGASSYSDTWSFTTEFVAAPSAPELLSPANDAINVPTAASLVWHTSNGATRYHLQVATDSLFENFVVNDSTLSDTTREANFGSFITYYWRVRAMNVGGASDYSSAWNFRTIFVGLPSVPSLSSPENGAVDEYIILTLDWNDAEGAESYRLQVASDSLFESLVADDSLLNETSKEIGPLTLFTKYYWRVNATNLGGTTEYSDVWNFTTLFVALPSSPMLVAPENGATNVSRIVSFAWQSSEGADSYQLQVSTDSLFETTVINNSTITDTTFQSEPLNGLTMYYWRVRAKNIAGTSNYSDEWNFTTLIAAPPIPVLSSPQNNNNNVSLTPTLRWRITERAVTYRVQLSTDSLFGSTLVDDSTLVDTLKQVGPLTNSTRYFWRVNAKNDGGTSAYSTVRRFTTIPPPPAPPTLLTPENGAFNVTIPDTFTWQAATGFAFHTLQIATDSMFENVVFSDTALFGTSRIVGDLSNATLYYWRMRSRNNSGTGNWSATWSFTTVVGGPPVPALLHPQNDATGLPSFVVLEWDTVSAALWYTLQISPDSLFDTLVFTTTLETTTYELGPLPYLTTVHWRVNSGNNNGTSEWSAAWNFTTGIPLPSQVQLIAPLPNAAINSDSVQLLWRKARPEVQYYMVQVARDSMFTNIFYADSSVEDTAMMIRRLISPARYWWRVIAYNPGGWGMFSDVRTFRVVVNGIDEIGGIPAQFSLAQNFPNPFNPTTAIVFGLPKSSFVTLKIYDVRGNAVAELLTQHLDAGNYSVDWNANGLASGVYYYRLHANDFIQTKKVVLMK